MSSINYFDEKKYKHEKRTDISFGIGDDGKLAFTTLKESETIAKVTNKFNRCVQFTPIDHNIKIIVNGNERSQCDGMLYIEVTKELVFVELKTGDKNWVADAIAQLESTIANFSANHVISDYKYRSAYAANRKHPYFQYSKKEEIETFRTHTRFRLNITNTIILK